MALLELSVTDLALIERARLALRPGLTVLTGETGAGKSLVIDALSLVTGGRADTSLVRTGATVARVEALFDRPAGVDGDPGEPLICVREVAAAGRTVARIDDQTVPAARLAAVVEPLVAIHGQHEQQRLLSASRQRDLLDAHGGHAAARELVAARVAEWRANREALAALEMSPEELERRLALALHVVDEVAAVAPQPGEAAELRARLAVLTGAERSIRLADAVRETLVGEGGGVQDQLARALHDARELSRADPRLEAVVARLTGLEAEAVDIADEVRRAAEGLEADLGSTARLEERLGDLYGLSRKYGETEAAVLAHAAVMAEEAARLESIGAERAARAVADERLLSAAEEAAGQLSLARTGAARSIATAITGILRDLGFPDAAFSVQMRPAALDASGADDVTFLLAPNLGEPERPLARIASGGELSRVSLAIEQVLATADTTATLVFDEVDAGIGGRSADPVGRSLWRLARHHQVLCVTHLPQIAAHADAHLHIAKSVRDGRTVTDITELSDEDRVAELAAMLGGARDPGPAHDAARELLEHARAFRAGAGPT
jgi:DNA repair protein RecN (Recombination protein N)